MRDENITSTGGETLSYAQILREIGTSTKDLVQSEVALATAELKEASQNAGRHLGQVVAFGGLLALSIFPFLAFLVIGIGNWMGGRYWLSSLLVAIVCAGVGGIVASRAYKKIKNEDLQFQSTRRSLQYQARTVQASVDDLQDAAKGGHHGPNRLH